MYSKQIQAGPATINVSESAGIATVKLSMAVAAGGGDVAGFLKSSVSAEVDLSVQQLIDIGFGIAESKYPSIAQYLKLAQTEIDALITKA